VWESLPVYLLKVSGLFPNTLYNVSGFSLPQIKTDRHHITEKLLSLANGFISILPTRFFYQLIWPWTLTLKNNRFLPLIMVIKFTNLYDSEAYSLVSILPTRFFLQSHAMTLTFENTGVLPLMMMIKCTNLYDPTKACGSISIPPTKFFFYYVTLQPWPTVYKLQLWSWSSRIQYLSCLNVFLLCDASQLWPLTSDLENH
jgi:hypothetical protein